MECLEMTHAVTPQLFEQIKFGTLNLINKIVIAPMCQYSATDQGEITYWHEQQWANYALFKRLQFRRKDVLALLMLAFGMMSNVIR